jgi:hypothetical protein
MKLSSMYKGNFRLKKSPYPELKVCDYPVSPQSLSYLEGLLSWLLDEENDHSMPLPMLHGIAHTAEKIQKSLADRYNKQTNNKTESIS